MKKKNILLTGASGTVGIEVLKQLCVKKDYNVTVFDKKSKESIKKLTPFKEEVRIVYGDITNIDDVAKVTKNIDFVIHLAAIIPPVADDLPALSKKVNVGGTKNLIKQLEINSPTAFFIYSSSISVYGDRIKNPYIKVDDILKPSDRDAYGETKIMAEQHIQKSTLDFTIFRLAAIMGNHKMSKLMFHQPLNTALEICTPRDTARAFVNAIMYKNKLSKRIFNLGGGEPCRISYEHFLERSFAIFGLGILNFPKHAFADKNFHCGFYKDGDDLENILHFRQDSLEDYFKMEEKKVSSVKKFVASIIKIPVKWYLLKQSEPYRAYKEQNIKEMEHYFNENA